MRFVQKSLVILFLTSCFSVAGCQDNPGTWKQDKVAAQIKTSLELTEATLTANADGGFDGTGKRADGETLTFTIQQDAEAQRMSWNADGDRGFHEDGHYEFTN